MKSIWKTIKIIGIKSTEQGTILQVSTEVPKEEIIKYALHGSIQGELKLDDGRHISAEQRRKIFACVKDFSLYTGYEAEYARQLLTLSFCYLNGIEPFSLSNCSLETARAFISYLIEFCIENDIPLSETAIDRTDDISAYLVMTLRKEICCVCGDRGILYNTDQIGNRISLCNKHFEMSKLKGWQEFEKLFKVYPIKG